MNSFIGTECPIWNDAAIELHFAYAAPNGGYLAQCGTRGAATVSHVLQPALLKKMSRSGSAARVDTASFERCAADERACQTVIDLAKDNLRAIFFVSHEAGSRLWAPPAWYYSPGL
jgi:hypothetical protein